MVAYLMKNEKAATKTCFWGHFVQFLQIWLFENADMRILEIDRMQHDTMKYYLVQF